MSDRVPEVVLLVFGGIVLGLCLDRLAVAWSQEVWTAILVLVTTISVITTVFLAHLNARYVRLIDRQLRDQMRALIVWDSFLDDRDADRWVVLVRNVGRLPATVGSVSYEPDSRGAGGHWEALISEGRDLHPYTAVPALSVSKQEHGTIKLAYTWRYGTTSETGLLEGTMVSVLATSRGVPLGVLQTARSSLSSRPPFSGGRKDRPTR